MFNEKARAHIRLILPFWSHNFPSWFGQQKKHGNYLQCGTESIPTQADDCGPGGLSSQESQPYLTTTYFTTPNQRYFDNWHALPHQYHTMPHNAMPYHAMQYHTVQRSRRLSHPVSSHKKSFSLAVSFMCHLLICPPLKHTIYLSFFYTGKIFGE